MEVAAIEQKLRDHHGDFDSWCVYGDWLLKQGDVRGTLISLEQRHARVRPAEREAVKREITALVEEHQESWDAEMPPGVTVLARRYGFVTKVAVAWSDDAPVMIERVLRAPFVTALRIAPPDDEEDGYESWAKNVDDDGEPLPSGSVEVGALATLDLRQLVELDLSYLRIGALGAKALAVSTYFRSEAADVKTLAGAASMGRLDVLDLRYSHVGNTGLEALAASPCFGGVRRLHLQRNALTAEGVPALSRFENLAELDLRYNEIGEEGALALLEAPFIGSLRRLLLYRADVGDAGAKILASAPQLPPALRSYWRSV